MIDNVYKYTNSSLYVQCRKNHVSRIYNVVCNNYIRRNREVFSNEMVLLKQHNVDAFQILSMNEKGTIVVHTEKILYPSRVRVTETLYFSDVVDVTIMSSFGGGPK